MKLFRPQKISVPQELEDLRNKALHLYEEGEFSNTVPILELVHSTQPNDTEVGLRLIHSLMACGKSDNAELLAKKLLLNTNYSDFIKEDNGILCITKPLLLTVSNVDLASKPNERKTFKLGNPLDPSKRKVFSYWIGPDNALISILRRLMRAHSYSGVGYEFVLLSKENVHSYVPLPTYFFELEPAHQADFLRVQLIYKYGGIWLDADTVVMESIDSLFEIIERRGALFFEGAKGVIINAVFGAVAQHPLMLEWKQKMEEILDQKKSQIGWVEIGNQLIDNIIRQDKKWENSVSLLSGPETIYPVFWPDAEEAFVSASFDNHKLIKRDFQPVVVLVSTVYKQLVNEKPQVMFRMDAPISYFLTRAFQNLEWRFLDFVEIGTSSFNTLVENANNDSVGMCVEPLKDHLDLLPDLPNVIKVNCAVTSDRKEDHIYMFYLPVETIEKRNLPRWLKGTNSINTYHPLHIIDHLTEYVKVEQVSLINIEELFLRYQVGKVGHLKIDTEGHDMVILNGLFNWLEFVPKTYYPVKITFESNELYTQTQVANIVKRAELMGYESGETKDGWNTILKLKA